MKIVWSSAWKGSKLPRKQRKYRANAPLHVKHKFLSVHLSKELRAKYARRAIPIRSGDKVKVLIGSHRGHVGKVDHVNRRQLKIFVAGIEAVRKDGSKVVRPIDPSNVMITELNLEDKKREAMLARAPEK